MGPTAGGNRLLNLLPTRDPERQAGCAIKALGVPPGKGGGGKPADYDGFTRIKPGREKPGRKKRHFVHLLLCLAGITPGKEMDGGIPGKRQEGREER